jgi:N-methylhydantoinase A
MRIGIDVGGTFTDVVLVDEGTATFDCIKTPTTHHDLTEGVLDGLDKILNLAEVSIDDIDHIIHGTTIGTNAIVEGKGARVGLITTAGFEDVLEIRRVARPKEAAFDFNANMAKGISGISVERRYDLRDFALVTMGGAAALHAADIAGELNINKIVVPPMSGNFSAVGLVVADIQHDLVRTYAKKEPDIDPINLVKLYKEMEHDGIGQLISEGVVQKDIVISWSADLRYEGQSWELNTIIRLATSMTKSDLNQIVQDFNQLHQQVYAYSEPDEVVEFVNLRVRAVGKNPTLTLPGIKMPAGSIAVKADDTRNVYFETGGWQKIPIYLRENLAVGSELNGPCIIEEPISTTLMPVGFSGVIDEFENIIIEAERAYGI